MYLSIFIYIILCELKKNTILFVCYHNNLFQILESEVSPVISEDKLALFKTALDIR